MEMSFLNSSNESNVNKLITSQGFTISPTLMEYTPAYEISSSVELIDHVPLQDNLNTRESHPQRRQRHRQQHREQQRELRKQQQRQQQHQDQQITHSESAISVKPEWNQDYRNNNSLPNYMADIYNQSLLYEYDLEKMDFQDQWEQECINEIEKYLREPPLVKEQQKVEAQNQIQTTQILQQEHEKCLLEQEGHLLQLQMTLVNDELEQLKQIDVIRQIQKEEEQRNTQQLIQHELWENHQFLFQQLHHN